MKKILLLHMLVFVSATLPISSVASDEVETLKCTSSQTPLPEIPYMRPENVPVVCLRARLLNFHWQSWGLIVESCSRQNHLRGN